MRMRRGSLMLVLLASSSVPSLVVRLRPLPMAARRPPPAVVLMRAPKDVPARFQPYGADLDRRKRASLRTRTKQVLSTLVRVALPTIIATILGLLYYDNLSLLIRSLLDGRTLGVLMADEAQFVQVTTWLGLGSGLGSPRVSVRVSWVRVRVRVRRSSCRCG